MSYAVEITVKDSTSLAPGRAIIMITRKPRDKMQCRGNVVQSVLLDIAVVQSVSVRAVRTGCMTELDFDGDWNDSVRNSVLNRVLKVLGCSEKVEVTVDERPWHADGSWTTIEYHYEDPDHSVVLDAEIDAELESDSDSGWR